MSLGAIGNTIPIEWLAVDLLDICNPKQWKTISTKDLKESGYVVYGANGQIGFYDQFTHESPTLMITCRGATCGNLHISVPYAYINGNAMAIDELSANWIGLSYLFYALKARGFEDVISGSAQPQITRQGLVSLKIPLAPLAEQKVIAAKLDELLAQVDILKTRLTTIPTLLKRFRQSVLAGAVSGKLTEETHDIKKFNLSDVSIKITDGEHITPKICTEGVPLLSAKDVQESELLFDDCKYISRGTADKALSRCNPQQGDILIVSRGATVGRTHLVKTQDEFCLMGSVLLIKINAELVLPEYMELVFKDPTGQKQLIATSGSSAQQAIYIRDVKNFSLSLPEKKQQEIIVRRVEQLFAFADQIEQQVKNAQSRVNNLTQSILAKAFRGELTADWRAENPDLITGENSAQALLAKIKTERDKPQKKPKQQAMFSE